MSLQSGCKGRAVGVTLLFFLMIFIFSTSFADIPVDTKAKTILVTCATGELGTAISKELASRYNLILTGRDSTKLQKLQKELQAIRSGQYDLIVLDYSSEESLNDFKKRLQEKNTLLSGLVLMTPRPNFGQNLLESGSEWLRLFQNCFSGPVDALRATLSSFETCGKIVIIGGTTSVQLMPEYGPACMVRRMWTTYAKALSYQLGPQGISVNVVSPGVVATRFHEERLQKKAESNNVSYDEQLQKDTSAIPIRRYPTPIEVARTVRFMVSDQSDAITGVNLLIDGGATSNY